MKKTIYCMLLSAVLVLVVGCASAKLKDGYWLDDAKPCPLCSHKPAVTWQINSKWSKCTYAVGCRTRGCKMAEKSGFRSDAEAKQWWSKHVFLMETK